MEIKKICLLSNGTLKEEYNIPNLIRCKECKYWRHWHWKMNIAVIPTPEIEEEIEKAMYCTKHIWMMRTDADDFCSRGERRDEADEMD